MKAILSALALLIVGLMAGLVGLLIVRGAPSLSLSFLLGQPRLAGEEGGILPVIIATGYLVGGALLLALPLGVGTALYLQEYAPDGRPLAALRSLIEALSGVPSVIFGLFGFGLFVIRLDWGWSLASGCCTLALMVLPTMIRTAEEALYAVPGLLREGAAALGATRWETIRRVALPQAAPGILTGAILALGRALGETAAVLLTAGSNLHLPASVWDTGRSLAVHLYILGTEGLSEGRAYATALVLVIGVAAVNLTANLLLARWRA